jgi:ribulose-phosphate 3-epimerase
VPTGSSTRAIKIAPSILAADFARLGEQVRAAEAAGPDRIHIDVMDGVFVPNISLGVPVVEALRRITDLALETHLMIDRPERYLEAFAAAGSDTLIVHLEGAMHLHRSIESIRALGKRAGVALNPATPVELLEPILEDLDLILIMSVNPGFGGQRFIAGSCRKLERARELIDRRHPRCELEVDGGIDAASAAVAVRSGADVLVAGTSVFGCPEGPAAGIHRLRQTIA